MKKLCVFALVTAAIFTGSAFAAATDDLQHFLKNTSSATGRFTQSVVGKDGVAVSNGASEGEFSFSRPGKFRWHYLTPYEELMITNGKTLWLYDTELEQVTIKTLTTALPATPASLLFGNTDFSKDFNVKDIASKDALAWLVATPKDSASSFSEVRIGFMKQLPAAMILRDNFGQETHLLFSDVKRNVEIQRSLFEFKVPKGVEVLEDKSAF